MAGNIKGIIIEIGGDTQKLEKALKEVDGKSLKLQSELKQVQKLLKLDSSNVTLVAQKQELLGKSIEAVKEKLTALKAAQADVTEMFQNGQITGDVYRTYQREIADTEISLQRLEGQLQAATNALDSNSTAAREAARAANEKAEKEKELAQAIGTAEAKIQQEQAELERNTIALGKNATEQQKLALKRESLTRQIDAQKQQVAAMRQQLELLSSSEEENEQAIAEQRAELARAETALARYEQELQNTTREMSTLSRAGAGFTAFGGKAEAAGRAIMPVSAGVALLGVAAVKTGADFDSAMGQVAATMGMTAEQVRNGCEDYEKLREAAKRAGEATKFTAAQAGEALNFLALAGYDANKAIDALPTVLNLAAAGGLELGYASDLVTDSMSALGIETEGLVGFSDELAKTSQKSNTNIAQLGEAIITVGGTAKGLAGGTVELNTALGILADNGIKGSDAGTALRQVILNLTAPTEKAAAFMEDLGLSAYDSEGNIKPLNETFKELQGKLDGMNDKERRNTIANIFDARQIKSAEALLANCGERFDDLSLQIKHSDDAASNMAETMGENLNGQITLLISQIQGVAIKLTEILMPTIRNVVTKISEWVDQFSNLDTGTQKVILAVVGIVAVAGPLLIVIGKIATGIGALLTVGSTLTAAGGGIGIMGAAIAALTGPVGIAVAAVAGLTVAGVALYKELNESAVPAVDLFADKVSYASDGTKVLEQSISDTTKTAVGAYMELEKSATQSLMELCTNTGKITKENEEAFQYQCESIQLKYKEMKDTVLLAMEEQYAGEKDLLLESFLQTRAFNDQQKADIINRMNVDFAERKEATSNAYDQINAIIANAEAEKRTLTAEEAQQIEAIQQAQQANAIQALSDSEIEARVILDRMKGYNEAVSIEIAAQTIQKAEEARIATIEQAEQKYNEEVAYAQKLKDERGIISDEEYQKMIEAAEKKKNDSVRVANEMKDETVGVMLDQNAELANAVDTSTGEILTKWEVFKNNTATKWNEIRTNMSQTTALIKTSVVKEFSELRTDIENKINNVKEMLIKKWREMVDSVKSFGKDMKQAGNDLIQGLINGITEKVELAVAKVKTLCQSIVNTAKGVFDEHSPSRVFYEIGDYVTQGLANGIAENGENAVGQMEALAEKILSTGDALSTGIVSKDAETGQLIYDNLYSTVMNRIDLYYQERDKRIALINDGTEENIKAVQQEVKETEKATNLKIKLYQQEYKAKLQLLDDEASEATKALQEELDAIDAAEEQKQRDEEELAHKEKINGLQQKLLVANEEERADIFKEIQKTEADRQKVLDKQALQDKKNGIREQMEQVREEAAEKKKALQEELEAKEYQLQQQRAAEVEHMNVVITLMQSQLDKKKELEKIASEISKKEEQIRTDDFAREKEKQTDKALTEIQKQEIARKEEKRQQNIAELESLKVRQEAEKKAFEQSNSLLWQTVSDFELAQQSMTNAQLKESNKRQEYSNHELFPSASADTPVSIAKAQTEEQNIIAEEQTEFKKEQWDDQTAYQAQKGQEQTKTFSQESKQQTDTFVANIKKGESEFSLALNRMKIILQEFSANMQAISSQWGQFFYDGITSTEGDIVAYINRMVRKMRESLENASFASRGDFEERSVDGSHRNGLSYVPFDNYNAILHKGEAVLTAAENRNYQSAQTVQGKQISVQVTQHIYSPTPNARQEQRRAAREFKKMGLEW